MLFESLLGGITGLIGSAISAYFNYKNHQLKIQEREQELQFELMKLDKEKELLKAEAEARIQSMTVEAEVRRDLKEMDAYLEAVRSERDTQTRLSELMDRLLEVRGRLRPVALLGAVVIGFVDGVVEVWRRSMRPAITTYQAVITTWLVWRAYALLKAVGGGLDPAVASEIFSRAVDAVIFLTVSCFTWWFGDRQMSRFLQDYLKEKKA